MFDKKTTKSSQMGSLRFPNLPKWDPKGGNPVIYGDPIIVVYFQIMSTDRDHLTSSLAGIHGISPDWFVDAPASELCDRLP